MSNAKKKKKQARQSAAKKKSGGRQARSKVKSGRADARRARAGAKADLHSSAAAKVGKPAGAQQSKNGGGSAEAGGKKTVPDKKPKIDLTTGRTLFPVDMGDGSIQYLPIAGEATAREREMGLFVRLDSVRKDPVNTLSPGGGTTHEPSTGRTLFATKRPDSNGKPEYLPIESEATAAELSQGKFVPDREVRKDPVNTLSPGGETSEELSTGRTLFATKRPDGKGKPEYLPKESEATAAELRQGKFVRDEEVEAPPIDNTVLGNDPVYEFENQRRLFATARADGTIEYLPKRSNATAKELQTGRYVHDEAVPRTSLGEIYNMGNKPAKYDRTNDRTMYPVSVKVKSEEEGKEESRTVYLPRKSKVIGKEEKEKGLYIPDDKVDRHERKVQNTALKNNDADIQKQRAKRAAGLPGAVKGSNIIVDALDILFG
jgi:hypothetical protein